MLMVIIKRGGTVDRAFDAIDGTVNSITATVIISYFKLSSYKEAAKG
jgi:hypothetical protein